MSTQAFPGVTATGYNDGMSLLDYFAGQVFAHFVNQVQKLDDTKIIQLPERLRKMSVGEFAAYQSYEYAEEMIKEREKRLISESNQKTSATR